MPARPHLVPGRAGVACGRAAKPNAGHGCGGFAVK
jgi:hypothetical protein